MINLIIILIIAGLVVGDCIYIAKQKKKGKCMGCSDSSSCSRCGK